MRTPIYPGRISIRRYIICFITFAIVLIACSSIFAQAHLRHAAPQISLREEAGLPYLQNYTPRAYHAHAQNWAVEQDARGVMYFGNTAGILEYDGVRWRLMSTPNKSVVRTLGTGPDGRIYVGAHSELGYLAPDSAGQMQYISLLSQLAPEDRNFNNIWKIHTFPGGVYFRSSTHLFLWAEGQMRVWKPGNEFHRSFFVHSTFYIREIGVGLLRMVGDALQPVAGGERFADNRLDLMLPLDANDILIGTRADGLLRFDGSAFHPFPTEADNFLRENQLYDGAVLPNGDFALATLRGGVAIIDRTGRFLQRLDKNSGLLDNTVWSVYPDRQGGLWLALNSGLARVEIPAPLTKFTETQGIGSSTEALLRHQGRLYAATGLGVYYLAPPAAPGDTPVFRPVSGIAAQSWSLLPAGRSLLAATSNGVYQIENDRAVPLLDGLCFVLYQSQFDSTRIYTGLIDGLGILQFSNGRWRFSGRVPGISEEIRSIAEDPDGALWLGTQFQGALRVKLPPGKSVSELDETLLQVTRFGQTHHLPEGEVNVYPVNRRVRFATSQGLRSFDAHRQIFLADSSLGTLLADTAYAIHRLVEDGRGRVWVERGKENSLDIAVLEPEAGGGYHWQKSPLLRMNDLRPAWVIYPEPGGGDVVWFGSTGGIVRYDRTIDKNYQLDYPALIRRVKAGGDSLASGGNPLLPMLSENAASGGEVLQGGRLDYSRNALRFEFAAPSYDDPAANRYQYYLEGFDNNWSAWTRETQKDYTNLPEGQYRFRLRARNIYGHESSEAAYIFTIIPPWYRKWWFYLAGLTMLLAGVFAIIRYGMRLAAKREQEIARLREAELTRRKNIELKEKNDQLEKLLLELNAAQAQVMRSETRFRSVAKFANDAIITANSEGDITFWNNCARDIFGYPEHEVLGKPVTMLMPESYREGHRQGMARFTSSRRTTIIGQAVEMEGLRKDGTVFPLELTLAFWETDEGKFFTGIIRDITRRKQEHEELVKTQRQLYQAEKMASLGKLTAGIAHEINTPVGVINSTADISARCIVKLEEALVKSEPSREGGDNSGYQKYLQILKNNSQAFQTASERVSKILASLKNFTRMDESDFHKVDIHEGIDSTLTLLESEIGEQIEVIKNYSDIPPVPCYPGELNQVFMHLLTNAVHAIPGKGRITIQTFVENEQVHIRITDSGIGISPEQQRHLFDPGFKTAGSRVKAGLGLFTSYNIIQKHRGQIKVESELNRGSTFTVSLPLGLTKT